MPKKRETQEASSKEREEWKDTYTKDTRIHLKASANSGAR